MKATSITKHEKTFFDTGRDTAGKEFTLASSKVPIKGGNEKMPYIRCRTKNGDTSFYIKEKHTKTQIVLHYTAGYLKGDVAALSRPNHRVSVPFIIARNGTILNLWSSAYWAYHLGSRAVGGNTNGGKRTIAVEMSNIGFLKRIGDNLVTVYSDNDVYCHISETQFYTKLDTPFRGEQYFATYTAKQYKSLILLLKYLTAEYNIPASFLSKDKRYGIVAEDELVNFRGITSHVNYRSSGKWDIGPAFNWEKVINDLA
ncbi:N-acetylmuramoyl-L-alanine amidase [Aquimarina sp. MMG016]|uniref:N-acetylmuramoyl-L-alanine amidase n=1 Tax=Aquimarina sp. MMG016 TaxID=2822690 RepID=UPI001B3A2467|nr:N-acetylmuramoyl-L-alanine amidase [Aquimarina sp. MMG016]MBQ4820686.1 N-acetylmuramoyl-L-alanine amidase [Aquimarina sp. MMG016]